MIAGLPIPTPPLSLALVGLQTDALPSLRAQIEWAGAQGFRAVQLNAAAHDCRPRDLDRSARRDLAALLRRCSLVCSGVDLWIPVEHFADPARSDRAIDAMHQAIGFVADIAALTAGTPVLSAVLPPPGEARTVLVDHAQRSAAQLADFTLPLPAAESFDAWGGVVGAGVDPAAVLLAGGALSPAREAARMGRHLLAARLSDADGASRVPVQSVGARLDLTAYLVSLSVAGYRGPLVVDVRGLANPPLGAAAALEALAPGGRPS